MVYSPIKATIHEILVWDGYMQFMPSNLNSVQLGDTIVGTSNGCHSIVSPN